MPKIALDAGRRLYPAQSSDHQYQANAKNLALYANEEAGADWISTNALATT